MKEGIQKTINIICAIALFLAVTTLPIKYYNVLRIVVFIRCSLVIFNEKIKSYWKWSFISVALLFNPILPIYLYVKSYWILLDVLFGILFLLLTFYGYGSSTKKQQTIKKQVSKNKDLYNVKY
ncbi:conserved membrane hypothetical protein [Tenacibaculum sediminilitoris]|uniref:DUF6804 family protein n=1 Tax=Tenacibaculum sediminilitoris TaxID=1820334 RepID=UPI003895CDE3